MKFTCKSLLTFCEVDLFIAYGHVTTQQPPIDDAKDGWTSHLWSHLTKLATLMTVGLFPPNHAARVDGMGQTEAGGPERGASFSQCAELTVQSQYGTKQTDEEI